MDVGSLDGNTDAENHTEIAEESFFGTDRIATGDVSIFGDEESQQESHEDVSNEGFSSFDPGLDEWDVCSAGGGHGQFESSYMDDDAVPLPSGYDPGYSVACAMAQTAAKPVTHFWEHGFWANIFGDSSEPLDEPSSLYRPREVPNVEEYVQGSGTVQEVATSSKTRRMAGYKDVVQNIEQLAWREQREAAWETAMRRWHSCILSWDQNVTITKLLLGKDDFTSQCQILVDVLHNKAPNTLLKRCNSLSKLVNDMNSNGLQFPCDEEYLYTYLKVQQSLGAPASRLKSLLEALSFCRHIFGMEELSECVKSRRCMGAASNQPGHVVKQAAPIKVEHLICLHRVLNEDYDNWDRLFSGMCLFVLYSRARWSDAQQCEKLEFESAFNGSVMYVEGSVAIHKTCQAVGLKHSFLPLTAPGHGVDFTNWAELWRTVRDSMDVCDLSKFPVMPAPDREGVATVRPLNTSEASKWLNMILERFGHIDCTYTSHSLKATCLSFAAKMGCNFEDRLALGYHTNPLRIALRYSRDASARPLRVLESCLAKIRNGEFRPDETRSGRFVEVPKDHDQDQKLHVFEISDEENSVACNVKTEDAGEASDGHVTTDSDSESAEDAVVMPSAPMRTLTRPAGTKFWQRKKFKTFHLSMEDHNKFLLCGRKITDAHVSASDVQRFDAVKCRQCFKSLALKS